MKAKHFVPSRLLATLILLCGFAMAPGARATVISSNIVNLANETSYNITDGAQSAEFFWSVYIAGQSAYVYATANTDVALATGVSNVTQITNASGYTFITGNFNYLTDVEDAAANGGIGQFVILRSHAGYYAVVRLDEVTAGSTLDATWWFQTNGTADFSSYVAPAGTLAQALDTNLTWTTSGATSWFAEATNTHNGISAAQSGVLNGIQTNAIATTVTGPGTFTFWWSSLTPSDDYDFDLEFSLDGTNWTTSATSNPGSRSRRSRLAPARTS